jgi:hypothetical protein
LALANGRALDETKQRVMLGKQRGCSIALDSMTEHERPQLDEVVLRGNGDQQEAARSEHACAFGRVAPGVE